ncbi:HlyD family secretion protein [Acidisphaera sp. S103]|uniref:HlyD family secretion protein n=1 Tax=Acidisphaera sp. S103 TaxID=1747223 RepID=UPI00131E8495|nr:HlyD family secretion protein [Acidisphaera sp. S103]
MVAMPRTETLVGTTEAASSVSSSPPPGRRGVLRRSALAALLLAGTAAAGWYGYQYWETGRFLVSTDDAYVQADYTTIAPKVSGYISTVLVADNQTVKAGQVLARIDDRDFRTALDQATADVAAADFAVSNLDAQISLQDAAIAQAKAQLAATQASLVFAQQDAGRYRSLQQTGAGTIQQAQHSQASQDEITAQVQRDEAALTAAERKIGVLATARQQAAAQADHSRALRHQAELNLGYTVITAPVDGTVGARTLRIGQYVTSGTQLMAVVPLSAAYIVANYKETQLTHVRAGQPVSIEVDGFPDATIKGHVDSLSPASGLEFALLPPDNATGNFTKIVQRIPVKITFDDPALSGRLRSGMSVEPTIDTKPSSTRTE